MKNSPAHLQRAFEMIFKQMINIDEDVSEEWKAPPEGYNEDLEDDNDFEATRFGMSSIDRLISAIGKGSLPVLSTVI